MSAPGFSLSLRLTRGALSLEVAGVQAPPALCVLGPNGAGKTTLVRALLGAVPLSSGRVEVGGALLDDTQGRVRVPLQERRLAYVPQGYGLFPHFTVLENLTFALGRRDPRALGARSRERLDAAIARFELGPLLARRPGALSGGEKQRVALGRALALEPRAILLDEPLAALDPVSRRETRAELAAALGELGLPTLLVTHDAADALALGDCAVVLEGGRVTQVGPPAELQRAPATAFVAAFFAAPFAVAETARPPSAGAALASAGGASHTD